MILVTVAYALLLSIITWIELKRTFHSGPDFSTLFILLIALQLIIPGLIIVGVLATGNAPNIPFHPFLNIVLSNIEFNETATVFILLTLFIFFFYFAKSLSLLLFSKIKKPNSVFFIDISIRRWLILIIVGFLCSGLLIYILGGYSNLIKFRNSPFYEQRTEFTSHVYLAGNLFAFLQMLFPLISPLGICLAYKKRKKYLLLSILVVFFFCLMSVSRRYFLITSILAIFSFSIFNKKFYWKQITLISLIMFPIIIIGKTFLWSLSYKGHVDLIAISSLFSENTLNNIVVFFSDAGRSTVESWATLLYLKDAGPRLGIDHILSILRRIPDGMLGLNLEFPERMVRISTTAFMGPEWADIPPGFLGQMWLDFRWLGPAICGCFYGVVIAFLQKFYNNILVTLSGTYMFVLVFWIICMPITSGTWDFVFSFEMLVLFVCMIFILKIKKLQLHYAKTF